MILPVKVICFSFIVYIVVLLAQPCQDLAAMVEDRNDNKTQISRIQSSHETDPKADECSPFCVCSCCSLSIVDRSITVGVAFEPERIAALAGLIGYSSPYSKAHQNSIWQPPKA